MAAAARLLIPPLVAAVAALHPAHGRDDWNGWEIMAAAQARQKEFPYVYEEQSIVRIDRNGQRDTRTARRYSRVEEDGTVHLLLVFETPPAVRGVALIAHRDARGMITRQLYLPALGPGLMDSDTDDRGGGFLGTDFTVESLTGEMMTEYQYVRGDDLESEDQAYFTVDVFRAGDDINRMQPLRRHFIRKDNFYIIGTDFFDMRGGVIKRQRSHDLKLVDESMWHANLMLMDDYREHHQTVIKVDRRIFSEDYVPADMFGAEWLRDHYPALPGAAAQQDASADETGGVRP
jgi:hypothetical protein